MMLLKANQIFSECKYQYERDFEDEITANSKRLFGEKTIFIDAKRKIDSGALGKTIPDGFLFDMSDTSNMEFYLVEVELEKHGFYEHIFPQITKFFGFFNKQSQQKDLVEKLYSVIESDEILREEFKKYLGGREIYKFLSDLIDSSQNILLVIDGEKPEMPEIMDTYSDTWGKMVKQMIIRKFTCDDNIIYSVDPEFESIEYIPPVGPDNDQEDISEDFHLEGVKDNVRQIYATIKERVLALNPSFIFNPQKHYISIRGKKNIAFIYLRKTKVRLIPLMPEEELRQKLKYHSVKTLSDAVQRFYNNPCASVDINDLNNIDDVIDIIKTLMEQ